MNLCGGVGIEIDRAEEGARVGFGVLRHWVGRV